MSFRAAWVPWATRPPQPCQTPANPSGRATVLLSRMTTAAKRRNSGTATASAATTCPMAAASTRSSSAAASGPKRWANPCALTPTPSLAATWVNSPRLAAGAPSQPSTSVWTKVAPVHLRTRRTNPTSRAASSATVVKTNCSAAATCARLDTRGPPPTGGR